MSSSYTVCILIFLVAPGTNMQNICFYFVFLVLVCFFSFFVFVINTLSAWNRKVCINGSFMLFNFLWFCLYCMYFFKGFWGRPQKYRSACERGRTCIFTGYRHLCNCRVVCCALVLLKHPIKHTVVGLWEKRSALSGICLTSASTNIYTYSVTFHSLSPTLNSGCFYVLIIKLYSRKHHLKSNNALIKDLL